MANNRMYLKCGACGESLMIAKHFGGPWELYAVIDGATAPEGEVERRMNAFFEEHSWCGSKSDTQMYLSYENASLTSWLADEDGD